METLFADQSATSSSTIVPSSSTSSKGKGKAQPESEPVKTGAEPDEPKAKEKNVVGRINNLASSDLSNLGNCSMYFVYTSTCAAPSFLMLTSKAHC